MNDESRPKGRRKPKPLRFAAIKVGDILIQRRNTITACRPQRPLAVANDDPQETIYVPTVATYYAVVTDRWFDPVYGQSDESVGQMVGLQYWADGHPIGSKWSHNLLGLARAKWNYATPDEIAGQAAEFTRARRLREALRAGEVVPLATAR